MHLFAASSDRERVGNQTANVSVLVNLESVVCVPALLTFSICQPKRRRGQDERQWAQTETQEVLNIREPFYFYCEGGQALAQLAQRGCVVSTLGDIQKPSGHGPGQLALGGPA